MTDTPPGAVRGEYLMLPLGATYELGSHQGYGLALMVDTRSTLVSGTLPFGLDRSTGSTHFFAAYNIAALTEVDVCNAHMDERRTWLRETTPAPGHERVVYPGLLEYEDTEERRAQGIPLHREVIQWFGQITRALGLPALVTLAPAADTRG